MDLGERIYQLRTQKNFSQEALAEALGVSRQSISKWETGSSVPELDKIVKLSEIFEVSLDELITGKEKSAEETVPTPPPQTEPKIIYVEKPVRSSLTAAQILGIILVAGSLLGFLLFDDLSEALFLCLPVTVWGTLCIVASHPLLWSCWCGSATWWIYVFFLSYRWEKEILFLILGVLMVIGSFAYTVYLQSKKRICIPFWGWALLVFVLLAGALMLAVNLLPPIEGSVTRPSEITVTPDGSVAIE